MNKLLLAPLSLLCAWNFAFAQSEYKPIQFFYRPSIGAMFPMRSPSPQYISDNLIGNKFQKLFGQVIDVGFFYKNFGLECSIVLLPAQGSESRHSKFVNAVNLEYASEYYASVSSGAMYNDMSGSTDPQARGGIGPAYKVERNRFVFVGRVMADVVSFDTDWGTAQLKQKGTNELVTINWRRERPVIDCFTISPSFTFAYRVSRRIAIDLDVGSWLYRPDIIYVEKTTSAISGNATTKEYRSSHFMNDVSVGLGIMVVFK
ncbi:MAG: hypothetical protein J7619_16075 [Dyadobacter sp.]|uniref:hypothetical protein n=1 Tax=Dyadobacter sp. TaxID=1914288 RepID=UPI001B02229B|nr:hypothetical protein [Dyadobacter sp.]MBO9614223.1 hypothetical protein [Dyadobacter sp.]